MLLRLVMRAIIKIHRTKKQGDIYYNSSAPKITKCVRMLVTASYFYFWTTMWMYHYLDQAVTIQCRATKVFHATFSWHCTVFRNYLNFLFVKMTVGMSHIKAFETISRFHIFLYWLFILQCLRTKNFKNSRTVQNHCHQNRALFGCHCSTNWPSSRRGDIWPDKSSHCRYISPYWNRAEERTAVNYRPRIREEIVHWIVCKRDGIMPQQRSSQWNHDCDSIIVLMKIMNTFTLKDFEMKLYFHRFVELLLKKNIFIHLLLQFIVYLIYR